MHAVLAIANIILYIPEAVKVPVALLLEPVAPAVVKFVSS